MSRVAGRRTSPRRRPVRETALVVVKASQAAKAAASLSSNNKNNNDTNDKKNNSTDDSFPSWAVPSSPVKKKPHIQASSNNNTVENDSSGSSAQKERERSPVRNWADYCDSDRSRSRSPVNSQTSNGENVSPLRKSRNSSPTRTYPLTRGRRASTSSRSSQQSEPGRETDIHRMAQRQKLIDYGKNTLAYANYVKNVPRESRLQNQSLSRCPVTPRKDQMSSKRGFDGQIRVWRKLLHEWWNPDNGKEAVKDQDEQDTADPVEVAIKVKQDITALKLEHPEIWDDDDEDLEAALQLAKTIT